MQCGWTMNRRPYLSFTRYKNFVVGNDRSVIILFCIFSSFSFGQLTTMPLSIWNFSPSFRTNSWTRSSTAMLLILARGKRRKSWQSKQLYLFMAVKLTFYYYRLFFNFFTFQNRYCCRGRSEDCITSQRSSVWVQCGGIVNDEPGSLSFNIREGFRDQPSNEC